MYILVQNLNKSEDLERELPIEKKDSINKKRNSNKSPMARDILEKKSQTDHFSNKNNSPKHLFSPPKTNTLFSERVNKITSNTEEYIKTDSDLLEKDEKANTKKNKIVPLDHKNKTINSKHFSMLMRKENIQRNKIKFTDFCFQSSCFCCHSSSKIRLFIGKLIQSKWWKYFVLSILIFFF